MGEDSAMNTGQRLVSLSGLPTGSAMAHLLAIQTGTGTGPSETIFASRFNVVAADDRLEITRKAKHSASEAAPSLRVLRPQSRDRKTAYALTTTPSLSVRTERDEISVTSRKSSTVATRRFEQETINRKRKTS